MSDQDIQPPKALRIFAWLMLAAASLFQLALVCAPLTTLAATVTVDDTYLYLQIARNWVDLGFPTFDGETPTSGFQPLWNFVLMALAAMFADRESLLRAACLLSALLNLLTGPLVWRLGKQLATPSVGYLSMVAWCLYLFCPRSPNGMESSLHGVIFALGALVALPAWKDLEGISTRRWLLLGGLLALNGLCRLDSGIVSALVAGVFGWRLLKQTRFRAFGALCTLPLCLGALYFGINQMYFGSPTPISGRVKMYWAYSPAGLTLTNVIVTTLTGTIRSYCHSLMYVSGGGEAYSYPWLPILLVLLIGNSICAWWRGMLDGRLLAWGAFLLVHTLVVYVMLQHLGKSYWYYQPLRIWAALVVGHLALWTFPYVRPRAMQAILAMLLLFACGFGIFRGVSMRGARYDQLPYETMNAEARALLMGQWIHATDELPADARIASWNAGLIGYFAAPKKVFNLDGLVQSDEYLEKVICPRAWKEYLQAQRIEYLVDTNYPDATQTYRQKWDREELFRGLVPFDRTRIVKQMKPLYLLDLSPLID